MSRMVAYTYMVIACSFSHPLRPPTQVALWENRVLPLCLLRDVVWHLQPDHSHPAKHSLLCESMLSVLW